MVNIILLYISLYIAHVKPIPTRSWELVKFICGQAAADDAVKLSSMKLQSLFDTVAERIGKMKRVHGNAFDKKISLQDSLKSFQYFGIVTQPISVTKTGLKTPKNDGFGSVVMIFSGFCSHDHTFSILFP